LAPTRSAARGPFRLSGTPRKSRTARPKPSRGRKKFSSQYIRKRDKTKTCTFARLEIGPRCRAQDDSQAHSGRRARRRSWRIRPDVARILRVAFPHIVSTAMLLAGTRKDHELAPLLRIGNGASKEACAALLSRLLDLSREARAGAAGTSVDIILDIIQSAHGPLVNEPPKRYRRGSQGENVSGSRCDRKRGYRHTHHWSAIRGRRRESLCLLHCASGSVWLLAQRACEKVANVLLEALGRTSELSGDRGTRIFRGVSVFF
jgi:hypothetical protein